ncbi:Leaf rust 10 disease-resistance locus receptor-like protein kinase [Actinidia chinensis var. chinensis]|uniref:non-specific serine/threonine protein kinase n=1 Tax=Actinidia chinensis var. chinensis TaxID=1590841 RepID=A0A2R6P380_ACTCC|nr:Leaf rust 10 disease-resistance locus receptor-like protein kinase [Actinidia chinensis var. chinensis]
MHPHTSKFGHSFQVLVISIVFAIFFDQTLSVDLMFDACKPQNCGNAPNISYPFWIANRQESYCGHPHFEVACNGKDPVLTISNDDYIIKDVFYANNSFLLAIQTVYDFNNSCPTPLHNFSIFRTPFEYSLGYADLFFFYDCTSYPVDVTYPVACASNSTHHSFAVFHKEILEHNKFSFESCHSSVNAPVEGEDIRNLLEMNFTDVLRKGFVLEWSEDDCNDCKRSGGRCGSVGDEFICYCPDQPHSKTCDDGDQLDWGRKLAIAFGTAGFTIVTMVLIYFIHRRCHKRRYAASSWISRNISSHPSSTTDLENAVTMYGVRILKYSELEKATNYFDSKKELGDGGFGTVYQGKLRDGRVVAVKRLYEHNYKRVEQFMNEIEILARLRHPNLVSLYGCTSRHCRELLLVYEYIPNGTVADHLHGEQVKPGSLSWNTRMSIAIQTASALSYLHASDVIHRDVKTNNILLDDNFCVKVADFGLSRLFPNDVTHVSTAPQGTAGYVDPEYHECYQLTNKSDVYSFGVVLIELISSKPAVDITRHRHEINLSNMAINKIQNHALHELVDPFLGFESDSKVRNMITDVAELAFQCLQSERDMRPSMEKVLENLKRIQGENGNTENTEEVEIPADEVVLLKSDPPPLSPDSVNVNWICREATPNASS